MTPADLLVELLTHTTGINVTVLSSTVGLVWPSLRNMERMLHYIRSNLTTFRGKQ